jgi:hypothetical protein
MITPDADPSDVGLTRLTGTAGCASQGEVFTELADLRAELNALKVALVAANIDVSPTIEEEGGDHG